MNFKSKVIELWQKAGTPSWNYEETLKACMTTNEFFKTIHKNPAQRLSEEIDNNNEAYIKTWIMGCHFEWLNPR